MRFIESLLYLLGMIVVALTASVLVNLFLPPWAIAAVVLALIFFWAWTDSRES